MIIAINDYNVWLVTSDSYEHPDLQAALKHAMQNSKYGDYWEDCEKEDSELVGQEFYRVRDDLAKTIMGTYENYTSNSEDGLIEVADFILTMLQRNNIEVITS